MSSLIGKSYTFDDGVNIKIVQIKLREENGIVSPFVTYESTSGNGIPRKLILSEKDFIHQFGHLFGLKEPPDKPF
jgi:hypothetical protein